MVACLVLLLVDSKASEMAVEKVAYLESPLVVMMEKM